MVIQTEIYPGFGYQVQQTYTALQDGYYSPNDHYGHVSNDRYCQGSGRHMPTSPYITSTPVLKPSGGYGQHHDDWFDTSKPQHGSNSTTTEHYSHGLNGQIPTYNNYDASKYNGGYSNNHEMGNSGYGTYHGTQAPMGVNTLESIKYEYEYSSSAKPTIDYNSNGMQSGYRRVWEIKNIDD